MVGVELFLNLTGFTLPNQAMPRHLAIELYQGLL